MKWIPVLSVMMTSIFVVFGCAVQPEDGSIRQEDPVEDSSFENFQLSITDNFTEDQDYDAVFIDFDRIEVSRGEEDGGWITVNDEGGTVDLRNLNDGELQTLVVTRLEPGEYRQIRFHVNKTWVVSGGREHQVKLPSDTIKLVRPFEIKEGIRTRLVADLDIHRSLRRVGFGRFIRYILIPVIRIVQEDLTGGIAGRVVEPTGVPVTISAYRDGEDEVYKSTMAGKYFGFYLLPYLEEGVYDVVIEADGYLPYTFEDVEVYVGRITMLDWVRLEQGTAGAAIIVNVEYKIDEDPPYGVYDLDDYVVQVTSFVAGGDLPEDEIETVDAYLSGGEATVVLDRDGSGYDSGTYGLRAHIDKSNNGLTTAPEDDYIILGEATVVDVDVSVTLDGPWGGYTSFMVTNSAALPLDATGSEDMYLVVVSQGDWWGNYAYSEATDRADSGFIGMDLWGPYGLYDFYAMMDMNGNFDETGAPDAGDYTYSNTNIDWQSGFFPHQTISAWE